MTGFVRNHHRDLCANSIKQRFIGVPMLSEPVVIVAKSNEPRAFGEIPPVHKTQQDLLHLRKTFGLR